MHNRQRELEWQQRAVERACEGGERAWTVLSAVLCELEQINNPSPALLRAANFVEALLDIKDATPTGNPPRRQLRKAFKRLGITPGGGRRKAGHYAGGWGDLDGLLVDLRRGDPQVPVLAYLADFIVALLDIKSSSPKAPTQDELSPALDRLHITLEDGGPELDEREVLGRLAAEKRAIKKAGSVAAGRARLRTGPHGLGELRQRDIRTTFPELARLVDTAELDDGSFDDKFLEGLEGNLGPEKN